MKWNVHGRAFHQDGSLRDIYVQSATLADWESFLEFVQCSDFKLRYFRDGEAADVPSSAQDALLDGSCSHNLVIGAGGVDLHCHFFVVDEIELDVDPRDVNSQRTLDAVLSFLTRLGSRLGGDVILTEENSPEDVWFRYSSEDGVVRFEHTA